MNDCLQLISKEILSVNKKINVYIYQLCFHLACQTVYSGPHCDVLCNSSCPNQMCYSEKEDCLQVYPCWSVLHDFVSKLRDTFINNTRLYWQRNFFFQCLQLLFILERHKLLQIIADIIALLFLKVIN